MFEDINDGSETLSLKKVFSTQIDVYEIKNDWIDIGLEGSDILNIFPDADSNKKYLLKKDGKIIDSTL